MGFFSWNIRRPHPLAGWMLLIGVVTGGLSGWISASVYVDPILTDLATRTQIVTTATTTPETPTGPTVISATGPAPGTIMYPPALVTRRLSPVATIAKKPTSVTEDTLIADEQHVGSAVAITSDGWFASVASVFKNVRVADVVVLWQGKTYPITKAVRDTATDAVYLKTAITGLPTSAFAEPQDMSVGLAVWTEPVAQRIYPNALVDLRAPVMIDPVLSEHAARRFLVDGSVDTLFGGAVWDERGQLVGLVESKTKEGWRVLPAGDLRTALSSLLANGEIRHASLGVRASDLARLTFGIATTTRNASNKGAWIRTDRRTNQPAVIAGGAAGKVLKEGDVIERIDRDILGGSADLGEILLEYRPGTQVTLAIARKGESLEIPVTLGSYNAAELLK
ncbi:MAG: PDZ domain-containing protein [Patescibacteria group bacterium]